jgi:PBP1b-binding outer membrane lipoprotein LpoB
MLKKIFPILLALAVLLTACAPQGTPTMAPADVQNTAVAAAWTMVQATQNAIPTATPLPPTETPSPTPLPTYTPVPLVVIPTLEQMILPTATTGISDPNNCNRVLNMGEAGPMKNIRIENENKSQVNLSLNLWKPNPFGQCGTLSYVIKGNEKRKVGIPTGSWYAYSWVLNPPSTGSVSFYIGPSGSDDLLRIVIKKDTIAWVGP